jgi:transcription elongation factor Elf1
MDFVKSLVGLNNCPICGASKSSIINVDDVITLRKYAKCYECGSTFTDVHTYNFRDFELTDCPSCHQKGVTDIILPNGEKAGYCVLCKEAFSTFVDLPEPGPAPNSDRERIEEFDNNIRPMIDKLANYIRKYEDIYFFEQLQAILHTIVDFVEGK